MYAKIFNQILDSTIANDWQVRHVFEDFLILADENGAVDMTLEAFISRTNTPREVVEKAIKVLEAPDPESRTPEHEGRRLLRLYEHKSTGWVVANHAKYRAITNSFELKKQGRSRMAVFRSKDGIAVEQPSGYVYYAFCPDGKDLKIGFSLNPWARLKELRCARPNLEIVATERGTLTTEATRHEQFKNSLKHGEWFNYDDKLRNFIKSLKNEDKTTTNETATLLRLDVATTDSQKQTQIQNQIENKKEETPQARGNGATPPPLALIEVFDFWNQKPALPKCLILSDKRRILLKVRLGEKFFVSNWRAAIQRISESPFCLGQNQRGWKATFEWFISPDVVVKIMEGKYAGQPNNSKSNPRNAGVVGNLAEMSRETAEVVKRRAAEREIEHETF